LRQAYDYWQDQPGNCLASRPCRTVRRDAHRVLGPTPRGRRSISQKAWRAQAAAAAHECAAASRSAPFPLCPTDGLTQCRRRCGRRLACWASRFPSRALRRWQADSGVSENDLRERAPYCRRISIVIEHYVCTSCINTSFSSVDAPRPRRAGWGGSTRAEETACKTGGVEGLDRIGCRSHGRRSGLTNTLCFSSDDLVQAAVVSKARPPP